MFAAKRGLLIWKTMSLVFDINALCIGLLLLCSYERVNPRAERIRSKIFVLAHERYGSHTSEFRNFMEGELFDSSNRIIRECTKRSNTYVSCLRISRQLANRLRTARSPTPAYEQFMKLVKERDLVPASSSQILKPIVREKFGSGLRCDLVVNGRYQVGFKGVGLKIDSALN